MKAEQLGYTNVKVFHDGMPVWKQKGNLVVSTVSFLKESTDQGIPFVLVDLRKKDAARKEHMPGAVSVPADEIEGAKVRFPADKSAPIVLYSDDDKVSGDKFKTVRGWGYKNATVLAGGIGAWKAAGNPVQSGKLAAELVYVPKPRPGEISIEDFKRIAETLPADTLILDIRDEDEAMQGMLKGAKNIPQPELKARLAEVPKDKLIVTHCITGVRAEMAYHILKEAGYNTKFLNANIKIDSSGKYEISKD
jgi:rhodanese-related sulfurtransferase